MGYFDYRVNRNATEVRNGDEQGSVSLIYDREGNRKYLTKAERNAFLQAAQRMPAEVRTFCLMLAYTGARLSEVLALTPRRIDAAAGIVIVESLKKRRRGVYRAVPIPGELFAELNRVHSIQAARQEPERMKRRIWSWCRTTAWNRVKECLELANISGAQATPKGLRHALAVGALQSGVPINFVRKWLGHARLSTTEIYADAVGDEERMIAKRFWDAF